MSNSSPDAAPRLIFLHHARTGGTSLHEAMCAAFPPEDRCPERFPQDETPPGQLTRYRLYSGHYRYGDIQAIPAPRYLVTVLRDPRARILSLYRFWRRHRGDVVDWLGLEGPRLARARGLLEFLHSSEPVVMNAIDNAIACHLADTRPTGSGRFGTWRVNGRQPVTPAAIVARACERLLALDCVGFTENLAAVHGRVAAQFPIAPLQRLNHRDAELEHLEALEDEPVTPDIQARLLRLTWLDAQVRHFALTDPRVRRA